MKRRRIYFVSLVILIGSIIGCGSLWHMAVKEQTRILAADRIETFAKEVQQQILTFDWVGLSEKISYPIKIGDIIYETKDAFAAEYFTYNDEFRKKIQEETCENMFVNLQGIRMGESGQVWFTDLFYTESGTAEPKIYAINGLLNQEAAEAQTTALTMEQVVALADEPKDFLILNEELRKYWIHDRKNDLDEKTIAYSTIYSVWDKEEEYQLHISYKKKRAELDMVLLSRVSDGEQILLYDAENVYRRVYQANGEDVTAYFAHHKQISDYFTAEIPENLAIGDYHAIKVGAGGSCLISSDAEDNAYLEELMVYANKDMLPLPIEWYAIGGMCCFYDCIEWEEGHISYVSNVSIHSCSMGEGENLEGCEVPARLELVGQDLFTGTSLSEAEMIYGEIPLEKQVVRQWYVYFAKPESRDVYVIWLNAELFSRAEMVRFAESVRFTEEAFQNRR